MKMGMLIELRDQDYQYCLDYTSGKTNTMALNNINRIIHAVADGKPLPENTMILDKDKLSCDCEWDDYCDGYTAYSPLALEAAEVEDERD